MANLLDEASILLSATAYNNGSMLAIKPENGDGDFTFSRNSAATRVNAQGLVENVQILSSNLVSNGDFSQEGVQEISNGSFSNGSTGWSLGGDVTIGNDLAHFESNTNTYSYIRQDISSLTSKTYKIQLEVKNYVSGAVQVAFSGASPITQNLNISSDGVYTAYLTPNANGDDFEVSREFNGGNFNFDITNISVKEVGQNWSPAGTTNASNYVEITENGARLVTDGTGVGISQIIMTIGKSYKLTFDVTVATLGSAKFDGALINFSSVGSYSKTFVATQTTLTYYRNSGAADITISNISVIEITDDTNLPRINYEGFSYQDSLGSELVVNGDFATDSNWIKNGQVTIGGGVAYFNSDGTFTQIAQSISGVSGKNVKVVIEITEYTQGTLKVLFSGGTQQNLPNSVGVHTLYFNNADSDTINIARLGGVTNLKIDNVSVKEVLGQEVVPNSGCGSWLLEPQSTNLIPYSELFSDAYWTKSGSIVVSGFVSPDGTNNAFKLVENNITFVGVQSNPSITSGVDYTFSAYAKAIENNYLFFNFNSKNSGFVNEYVWFNLLTGVVGTSEGSIVASIKEISNGFYRCIATATAISTTYGRVVIGTSINDGSYAPSGVIPTDGCYIYGAQLEQNSFATSYIPTQGGAISTRLADIATNSGNASLINSEEGVLYFEGSALSDDLTNRYLGLSDNSQSNRIAIGFTSAGANRIRLLMTSGIGNYVDISYTVSNITSNTKIAISYKLNDVSLWVNGLKVGTDTSAVMPSGLSELNFDSGTGGSPFYGKTKAVAVYKTALTDAQLTLLTTI